MKTENITTAEKLAILQEKFGRKDLSAGCEVKVGAFKESAGVILHDGFGKKVYYHYVLKEVLVLPSDEFKIIGHPLTLSDVLIVLQTLEDYPIHIDFFFDKKNELTITQAKGHPIINKECAWNLSHNLLREQSKETIDDIFEILKPKQ